MIVGVLPQALSDAAAPASAMRLKRRRSALGVCFVNCRCAKTQAAWAAGIRADVIGRGLVSECTRLCLING